MKRSSFFCFFQFLDGVATTGMVINGVATGMATAGVATGMGTSGVTATGANQVSDKTLPLLVRSLKIFSVVQAGLQATGRFFTSLCTLNWTKSRFWRRYCYLAVPAHNKTAYNVFLLIPVNTFLVHDPLNCYIKMFMSVFVIWHYNTKSSTTRIAADTYVKLSTHL